MNPVELKVVCGCGQKYKFDVQPVNGQMPFTVSCPSCGVDGTPVANQLLTEHFTNNPPPPAPAPPPPAPGGLRINRPAPVATPPPLPPSVSASSSGVAPAPMAGRAPAPAPRPLITAPATASKDFNLGLGILGAFLGSVVGGALVYGFFALAGFRFPLTGTVVGLLAALAARWLARGRDTTLGIITAVIALVTISGAIFFMYGGFPISGIISIGVCGYLAFRLAS